MKDTNAIEKALQQIAKQMKKLPCLGGNDKKLRVNKSQLYASNKYAANNKVAKFKQ